MAHISDNSKPLSIRQVDILNLEELFLLTKGFDDVCLIRLPSIDNPEQFDSSIINIENVIAKLAINLGEQATLIVVGEIIDLLRIESAMPPEARYQHWIAIRRINPEQVGLGYLANEHFGALVHTRYTPSLKHTKTRIKYTYCPICDKTTKDYGGKKHTYHSEGTLISDVWRDVTSDLKNDLTPVVDRFADLFGLDLYKELVVFDCTKVKLNRIKPPVIQFVADEKPIPTGMLNSIVEKDCLSALKTIPDNSIDYVFADPPYNLRKKYLGYSDDLEIKNYFDWCDEWIAQIARILKPGRTFSLLNIPLWSVRHFLFAESVLNYQNWIVWDALSFPVRLIMPSHYTILNFSKGKPRSLPGLIGHSGKTRPNSASQVFDALKPLADFYCLRSDCIDRRIRNRVNDRSVLTDIWSDIHRLKHNSRRVDHPCQLPPQLMYRLISLFTEESETVLDCFNGAGTTTLSAHQINRNYIGIEASSDYCEIARCRHEEISAGVDPFRKVDRVLISKNSPVARMPKQKYVVSKKVLQLEVREISKQLGHLPTRQEVSMLSHYPIDYFDKYFTSWGEVTAAARTTGMSEKRGTLQLHLMEIDS